MHAHAHSGHAHSASHPGHDNQGRLGFVLVLSALYMGAEALGGWLTGSLALWADAGHTLSDVSALALSLWAMWMARRPATTHRTYGHTRAEILAALIHGGALVAVAAFIVFEALERIQQPPDVILGPGMVIVASGGLAVNVIGMWLLNRGRQENLNVRGAWLHLLTDALGSLGVMVAGLLVWTLGWLWADAVASLAITVLVLLSAWALLRDAIDVLMETAPRHLDLEEIRGSIVDLAPVVDVHDLHVWTIGNGEIALSTHVVSNRECTTNELLARITELVEARFGIAHATIQVEDGDDDAESEAADGVCAGGCSAARVSANSG